MITPNAIRKLSANVERDLRKIRYIAENPKKAHLRNGEFLFWKRE